MNNSDSNKSVTGSNFIFLWGGQSLSLFGDQILLLALPLLAVEVLHVSAAHAALIPFAMFSPFLLIGLQAGALIDRLPKKRTMIFCDLVQLSVFGCIATLAFYNQLTFPILMMLVAIGGSAVVFFQVAYTSYLPEIVEGELNIQKGNSRLFLSESLARIFGPMLGGPIIAVFGIVMAVFVNALTFFLSFVSLSLITQKDKPHKGLSGNREKGWMRKDIWVGLKFVFNNPKLEPIILCGLVYVFFLSMIEFSLVLYCREILGLDAATIGVVVGATAAGFPIGNLICTKLAEMFDTSQVLVLGAVVSVIGVVLIPVMGSMGSIYGLVAVSVLHGVGEGAFGPTALTIRQTVTPPDLLGRVNSVQRFLIWGAIPLSSLATSLIIKLTGLSATLWVGGIGATLCLLPLLRKQILEDLKKAEFRIMYLGFKR